MAATSAAASSSSAAVGGAGLGGGACVLADEAETRAVLAGMSLQEKVGLVSGSGMWANYGVPRLNLKPLCLSDGPHGARGLSLRGSLGALLSPCETALAATFDVALVEEVGEVLGTECLRRGADMLLGPCLNLHRFPNSGRHFECFSEDPYLTSRMGVAYVKGVQRKALACAKHFVCNDQETDRGTQNSAVEERALREVYLAPFEAAVREGGVVGVMCGYNRVNGAYCTENPWLLSQVLRGEWGYKGLVMSDWFGNQSTEAAISAGLDLEMPGIEPRYFGGYLVQAVRSGQVSEDILDKRCLPLLRAMRRPGRDVPGPPPDDNDDAVLTKAAAESCVLLRNERQALPLDLATLKSVALIGPNAERTVIQGGGSSRVHTDPAKCPSILDEFSKAMADAGGEVLHAPGCSWEYMPKQCVSAEMMGLVSMGGGDMSGRPGAWMAFCSLFNDQALKVGAGLCRQEWFRRWLMPGLKACGWRTTTPQEAARALERKASRPPLPEFEPQGSSGDEAMIAKAEEAARSASASVLILGTHGHWELEGLDQPHMRLLGRQDELVERVAAASRGPVIVVLNVGSPKELPWLDKVDAVLLAHFGGQGMAAAVVDVLLGRTTPSGRLPTTWPRQLADVAAKAPPKEPGELGDVVYVEGLNVGYRGITEKPLFHFGFGLSYTTFSHGPLSITQTRACGEAGGPSATVSVAVRNEGSREGAQVVLLFSEVLSADVGPAPPPGPRALRAFGRTKPLAPGASEEVRLELGPRGLGAWFDTSASAAGESSEGGCWRGPSPGWRVRLTLGESAAQDKVISEVVLVLR